MTRDLFHVVDLVKMLGLLPPRAYNVSDFMIKRERERSATNISVEYSQYVYVDVQIFEHPEQKINKKT